MNPPNTNLANSGENKIEFLKKEMQRHTEILWGDPCTVEPVLIEKFLGDGLQVLYWGTIDQRPYYWMICIDSKTDINADELDENDELLNMVIDQCGEHDPYNDDDDENVPKEYPIVVNTMGTFWGVLANFDIPDNTLTPLPTNQ